MEDMHFYILPKTFCFVIAHMEFIGLSSYQILIHHEGKSLMHHLFMQQKSPGEEEEEEEEALYKKGSDICLQSNPTEAILSQDTESTSECALIPETRILMLQNIPHHPCQDCQESYTQK